MTCPLLCTHSFVQTITGKMVKDVDCFDDVKSFWPLGYTATRKFPSLAGYLYSIIQSLQNT